MTSHRCLDASQMCNPPFVYNLAANSNGKQAAAALGDGTVGLLSFAGPKGKQKAVLEQRLSGGHSASVSQVLFPGYANDGLLVSAGNDSKICIWDLKRPARKGGAAKEAEMEAAQALGSRDGGGGGASGEEGAQVTVLKHSEKINWLAAANTSALFVADTSSVIVEYAMPL